LASGILDQLKVVQLQCWRTHTIRPFKSESAVPRNCGCCSVQKMSTAAVVFLNMFGLASALSSAGPDPSPLTVDLNGASIAHRYDGHGALSAGASSRLLRDYPEKQRDEILDLLFKPKHGMSLDIIKVEIGGDMQSTDGTEPSHARSRQELADCNIERGYETWLLQEAKKRNPEILVSALAWGVPAWVNAGTAATPNYFSRDNIEYQVSWVKCVKEKLGITTDFLGIWNERFWGTTDYVVELRKALDQAGFNKSVTGIVMLDGVEQPAMTQSLFANTTFADSIEAVGMHYPCDYAPPNITTVLKKKLWASEDFSTPADWGGAGCWGRLLNSNYVRMNMTSTISWSLLWAVYPSLAFFGQGHFMAFEPWSGHYEINPTVWTTAHTTQFVKPGWHYLLSGPGGGSGELPSGGGTYVTMREVSPSGSAFNWTLVIETLTGECVYHNGCYSSGTWRSARKVQFRLTDFELHGGDSAQSQGKLTLHFWATNSTHQFLQLPDVQVTDGSFTIEIAPDSIYTLSTTSGQSKGGAASPLAAPPASAPFPLPYNDSFDEYKAGSLAKYWADMSGSFEVRRDDNINGQNGRLQQVVLECPIGWVAQPDPFTMAGFVNWTDYEVSVDARADGQVSPQVPANGCGYGGTNSLYVSVCGRMAGWSGVGGANVPGYCLRLFADGKWVVSAPWPTALASGQVALPPPGLAQWHKLGLRFSGPQITAFIDGKEVARVSSTAFPLGLAALTSGWHAASFDNFEAKPATPPPAVKNGLLASMDRLKFDYHSRSCWPQPVDAELRNNFTGKIGLEFKVSGDKDVVATDLLRFMVDGNWLKHDLELLEVQSQSAVTSLAKVTLDMVNSSALPVDGLGFTSVALPTPVTLSKGKTYHLVSSEWNGGDRWFEQMPVHANTKSGLSIVGSVWYADGQSGYNYGVPDSYSYGPVSLYFKESDVVQYV